MRIFDFSLEEVEEISRQGAALARAQELAARTNSPLNFPMTQSLAFSIKFVSEHFSDEDIRHVSDLASRLAKAES